MLSDIAKTQHFGITHQAIKVDMAVDRGVINPD